MRREKETPEEQVRQCRNQIEIAKRDLNRLEGVYEAEQDKIKKKYGLKTISEMKKRLSRVIDEEEKLRESLVEKVKELPDKFKGLQNERGRY